MMKFFLRIKRLLRPAHAQLSQALLILVSRNQACIFVLFFGTSTNFVGVLNGPERESLFDLNGWHCQLGRQIAGVSSKDKHCNLGSVEGAPLSNCLA